MRALDMPPPDWELILVDNGSTDSTMEIIRAFAKSVDFRVAAVYEPVAGSGTAKNAGMAYAKGDVLAYTDDDCYVWPDFLLHIARIFETEEVEYLGGRVVLHDPKDAPMAIKDDDTPSWLAPYSFIPAGLIHGANMAARRVVVETVGGFDPLFGAGAEFAAEDLDLIARACWAGWRGKYDPRPVVAHHHGRRPGEATSARLREYDYGRGAYYAKFLLNPRTRYVYLRHWYWSIRSASGHSDRVSAVREVVGALRYLRASIASGKRSVARRP